MQTIGVIDLRHGRAVHAVAGARDRYAPVTKVAGKPIPPGDAMALAGVYVEDLGVDGLYVADLGAILDGGTNLEPIRALASRGVPLWFDGAIASVEQARRAGEAGVAHPIVGLETLPSYAALDAICRAVDRVAFGLDLRGGRPIVRAGGTVPERDDVDTVVARAVQAGACAVVAVDLARVGTAAGPDEALIARVRIAAPQVSLVAGGGVRDARDLARLAAAGCDAVLLATTLHDGRLTRDDLAAARELPGH